MGAMSNLFRVVLLAGLGVIVFDTLGSLAALTWDFPYSSLLAGSLLIYGAAGFFATRVAGFLRGAVVAGSVGLIDATIGWMVSWLIGPGRLPPGEIAVPSIISTIVFVIILAAGVGIVGGALARVQERWRDRKAESLQRT
jgi:hypothetical protein